MTADLIDALVGPHVEPYRMNPQFHHAVNALAAACEAVVSLAAVGADAQSAVHRDAVRDAMHAVLPPMLLEPGDVGYDEALDLARDRHPSTGSATRPRLVACDDPTDP